MPGYIALHRSILDWEWYEDINVSRLFIHLLLRANHADNKWQGIEIKRGQLLTSRDHLASESRLSIMQVRTSLNKLKSTSEITIKTTSRYSLITINNYNLYQSGNQPTNKRVTSNQPASNQQVTTNNNDNNDNNEKKENAVSVKTKKEGYKPEFAQKYIDGFNKLFDSKFIVTPARANKLKLRFQTFTGEQIAEALLNLAASKFHQGDNDRGWKADPDFLIRSDEQVDTWLNHKGKQNDR